MYQPKHTRSNFNRMISMDYWRPGNTNMEPIMQLRKNFQTTWLVCRFNTFDHQINLFSPPFFPITPQASCYYHLPLLHYLTLNSIRKFSNICQKLGFFKGQESQIISRIFSNFSFSHEDCSQATFEI